eukprot:scaffold68144_cov73-Phaeocystis_antarctica.AAC.1
MLRSTNSVRGSQVVPSHGATNSALLAPQATSTAARGCGAARPYARQLSPRRWQGCHPDRAPQLGPAARQVELPELRQHTSRRRQRTCRRRRRHEGGEALVAERVATEIESLQRGPPAQGRREGHQSRVADTGVGQLEALEPWQGASSQGGGERRGACVAHVHRYE